MGLTAHVIPAQVGIQAMRRSNYTSIERARPSSPPVHRRHRDTKPPAPGGGCSVEPRRGFQPLGGPRPACGSLDGKRRRPVRDGRVRDYRRGVVGRRALMGRAAGVRPLLGGHEPVGDHLLHCADPARRTLGGGRLGASLRASSVGAARSLPLACPPLAGTYVPRTLTAWRTQR